MNDGYGYVLHTVDGRFVKIGFTRNLRSRWLSHRSTSTAEYGPLDFVGAFRATAKEDSAIRRRLAVIAQPVKPKSRDWFLRNDDADQLVSSLPMETHDISFGRKVIISIEDSVWRKFKAHTLSTGVRLDVAIGNLFRNALPENSRVER